MSNRITIEDVGKYVLTNSKCKLISNQYINYKTQHSYIDCKYKNILKFGFLLTDINVLVEIDGERHRKSIEYFGGIKGFKLNQIKNEIKYIYCAKIIYL